MTRPDYPLRLDIEPTNACQLSCIMCPRGIGKMTRPVGFMKQGLLQKIIDESQGKTRYVWAHVFGEPLLHLGFEEMIAAISKAGMRVEFSTNAMLLDKARSRSLLEADPDCIILSLDSLNKEKYGSIRKGGDFETVLENIEDCIAVRRQMRDSRTYLLVQFIDFEGSEDEIRKAHKIFDEKLKGIGSLSLKFFSTYGGKVPAMSEIISPHHGDSCEMVNYALTILWNGDVTICCHDVNGDYVIGNVNDSSIAELWNSEKCRSYHDKIMARDFEGMEMCRNCIG